MKKPLLICAAGNATVGKNLFCNLVEKELKNNYKLNVFSFGLADALKNDMYQFLLDKCKISVWNCSPEEKELIRPLLVEFGRIKRIQSNGTYWWKIIDENVMNRNLDVALCYDCRYDVYPQDERYWVQDLHKGVLVYIKKYDIKYKFEKELEHTWNNEPLDGSMGAAKLCREYTKPANKDESENNIKLEKAADYIIDWESCGKDTDKLSSHINDFVDWLVKNNHINICCGSCGCND